MAQQFDYPKTETQLREIQDKLYQHSKEVYDAGGRPAFKGLLEIMSAEPTIITAIHNIKSNHGSETPGVDSKTMRNDYLHKPFSWVVNDIQSAFRHYEPQKIRRVYIDKPGKSEKRPLGIPTIRDRIVQECMRIVLESIFEAQFFAHSYGFRPMRDAPMALERTKELVFNTGYYWIVEGDISKCFDRIDHSILLKRLYHMGVKDRRVLQIIKAMLKAGVMENGVTTKTKEGSPQGGPLSPLLANIYLNEFDQEMARRGVKMVRYADDIVVVTKSKRAAEHMLESCRKFLEGKLKLTMNLQKSKVVSLFSIRNFKFLGCCLGKNGRGIYIRVHRNSLQKAKQKLRELTNRSQGRNVRMVMAKVKEFIRGWIGYFYIADMKRILQSWDKWLRRRIRMYIWKQWKKPKTRVQNLKKLGIPEWQAYQWGNTRLGYWRVAGSAILSRSITNEKLALAGYYDFPAQYEQIRKLHLCD